MAYDELLVVQAAVGRGGGDLDVVSGTATLAGASGEVVEFTGLRCVMVGRSAARGEPDSQSA